MPTTRPLVRPVPDRLIGLDRFDLIGSGTPHLTNLNFEKARSRDTT